MSYYISSVKYIIQLMNFNEVETRIYKSWNPSNWKVINCFIIWHILYVSFTLKISFYRDVFFGLAWCKTLAFYIHRTLRHARWINAIFTARYVRWGEYNALSENVTRDVNQSEKKHYLKSYNNVYYLPVFVYFHDLGILWYILFIIICI